MDTSKNADDISIYLSKNVLETPGFLSNNNNPFLVSPYTPLTNVVKQTQFSSIIIIIAAIEAELSTLFDFNTMTLRISTITNIAGGNSITISTANLNLDADNTTITGNVYFSNNAYFSTLSGSTINASTINASTINFSTLTGSTINASIVNAATINFSTLSGSTINASTINASSITFSTLTGTTINANNIITSSITFSSLTMIPSSISSFNPSYTFNSSILISLNGSYFHVPIYPTV